MGDQQAEQMFNYAYFKMRTVISNLAKLALEHAKRNIPKAPPTMRVNILKSAVLKERGDIVTFGFLHKDADALEKGKKPVPFSGTYVQNVKRHSRRTKSGMTSVKKHRREYKNHRPKMIDGKWFMLKATPEVRATGWLEKAANRMFEDKALLAKEIKRELES